VLGEKVNAQDFQKLVDEYMDVIKMTQNRDNLTDQEQNQVKDMVWNTYVQNKLIADQAEKLGLTVTDEELQNIIKEGNNPMLMQTPFVNQQTGRFDTELLKKFLSDYKSVQKTNPQMAEQYSKMYNYWNFIEKNLRQQTLAQKFQTLLQKSILSNPVSAKMAFHEENEENSIELAAFPYSSVKDTDVKIADSDLKAKYDELKERFYKNVCVPGSQYEFNQELEKALRLEDFFEIGKLMAFDALNRNESCGGHFRIESQTEEGEAKRDDQHYMYVAAWEYKGVGKEPELHKEPLNYEFIEVKTRNYKD
jgi:hypothetical protein